MAVVTGAHPNTIRFVQRHPTLFEERLDPETLYSDITLRTGAPIFQMLTAPEDFVQGSAEPWIVDVLCALLRASDQRSVLETGAFVGATAVRLAQTLAEMGGGKIVACELDVTRAITTQTRLTAAELPPTVEWRVVQDDVLTWIQAQPDESIGFSWVDDAHEKPHVHHELELLVPKMVPNGIICGHDVWGSCDLQEVFTAFGGYALDLPRLGPAGGIGIIQVR